MLRKFRLLLTTAFAAVLLIACGSETNENASIDESTEDAVEVQATETEIAAADEESVTEDADSAEAPTSSTEETSEEDEAPAEEASTEETETATEEVEKPAESADETTDAMDPLSQTAIEQILTVTGLNIEEHSYSVQTTEEYAEVEIYEKTEQDNTPLVGIYRYFPDSGEILVSDYLTGEFVPYENLEQE